MPLKLRVKNKTAEGESPSEYLFEKEHVTIGRASENDLTLPDEKRIVSSQHAEIRYEGESYHLADRGSKNFTYLHNQRLQSNQPHQLQDGDVFTIGEFEIEFSSVEVEQASPSSQETVFAADFSNPFADPAKRFTEALEEIVSAYEQEAPRRRDDALEDAFRNFDRKMGDHEAVRRVLSLIGVQPSRGPDAATHSPDQASTQHIQEQDKRSSQSAPAIITGNEMMVSVLDVLIESMSRIIEIPWNFRHEFIGQTIMQSAETQFLYDGDASTMKEHLLDTSISEEERRKRLKHVEEAADALPLHQVAMIDGYKASVRSGAEELMSRLNPDVHQNEVISQSKVYEYLPVLSSPASLDRLRAQWNELRMGNLSAAHQRIFRPAFEKAYLARMTAVRPSGRDPQYW